MNVLVDLGHPAHAHVFRNAILHWKREGHKVIVTIRDRDIVPALLQHYGIDYSIASIPGKGFWGLSKELIEHDWKVWRIVRREKIDVMLGTSVAIAHASRFSRAKSILFNMDDADIVKEFAQLAYPFADYIVVPEVVRDRRTRQYITHTSCHELAYLHPDLYTPDPRILDTLGVAPHETFFIVRLVALKAFHDVGQAGLSLAARRKLIQMLSSYGKVFITAEGQLPEEFRRYQIPLPPERIHDALSYAKLLVSDSQTMTREAAVLGVPSIRCNTFVGRLSAMEELEQRYDLTYGFLPGDEERMFARLEALLTDPTLSETWQGKRARLLAEKPNLTRWMIRLVDRIMTP